MTTQDRDRLAAITTVLYNEGLIDDGNGAAYIEEVARLLLIAAGVVPPAEPGAADPTTLHTCTCGMFHQLPEAPTEFAAGMAWGKAIASVPEAGAGLATAVWIDGVRYAADPDGPMTLSWDKTGLATFTIKDAERLLEEPAIREIAERTAANLQAIIDSPASVPEAAPGLREWSVFPDEDGVWPIVTKEGGDYVAWPEMGEADCDRAVDEHNAAVRKASELTALFDLQQTRMERATTAWQEATGNPHTLPDLGRLLDWLVDRAALAPPPPALDESWDERGPEWYTRADGARLYGVLRAATPPTDERKP